MKRLYIVVRSDLPGGDLLSQSIYAVATFARRARVPFEQWFDGPNNIVALAIPDEPALAALVEKLQRVGRPLQVREPDLDNQLTAIAFEGYEEAARLVSSLPLALRPPRVRAVAADEHAA